MLVLKICPNFIIQIYQPFILYWYWWCFQTPLQPLQWENTTNCGRWVELCGGFGSFIWSVYVSALGCGTAAAADTTEQWTIVCVSGPGQHCHCRLCHVLRTCSGDDSYLSHRRFCWLIETWKKYYKYLSSGWRPSATPQQPIGALHLMTHREMCEACTTPHFAPPPHCSIASLQHCTRIMFLSITDCRGWPGLHCYHQQPHIIDIRY